MAKQLEFLFQGVGDSSLSICFRQSSILIDQSELLNVVYFVEPFRSISLCSVYLDNTSRLWWNNSTCLVSYLVWPSYANYHTNLEYNVWPNWNRYNPTWYNISVKIQKMFYVTQIRWKKPCVSTAVGLYEMSMENFGILCISIRLT